MRILLLLLISFNCFAKYKYDIKDLNNRHQGFVEEADLETAKASLSNIVVKSNWMKCDWMDEEASRVITKLDEGVTKYCEPKNFILTGEVLPDTSTEEAIEAAIEVKLRCGQDAIKYIAKRNVLKGLTNEQIKQMATTYSLVLSLLGAGAIDTALIEIAALIPDGIIVTPQDKTEITNYITACNN